jgi:pyrimidine-nucleoside phosphorylase
MSYIPAELIKKKRNGGVHTADEIRTLIRLYSKDELPDYQMAAWLMAVFFSGMTGEETTVLTEAMLHSGLTLDFSHLPTPAVDKHSTGGVGDKTSMIIAPIAAAAGVPVPMIAGRGLGHTGGTLDKLEAIPGFNIRFSLEEFRTNVEKYGVCIIGQTDEICPADKKIYALRDVTATVDSLPLICASIMSKKIAEGISGLVLDVKYGSGAFMKTIGRAETLANHLIEIGHGHGKKVIAVLSNMDQPLGRFIGNALEIGECIAILKNQSFLNEEPGRFHDTRELSIALAGDMIWLGGKADSREHGAEVAEEVLASGAAWRKFEQICHVQGGRLSELPSAAKKEIVLAPQNGFVQSLETEQIGLAAIKLGAGRLKTADLIDPTAGIHMHKKIGEAVHRGEALYTLFARDEKHFAEARTMLLAATTISLQKVASPRLIALRK